VRSGVLWRDLVGIRFRSRATPSPADLENILNYAASARQESVFIREIAIPFAERGNEGARNLANRIIRDVRNGASFAGFARPIEIPAGIILIQLVDIREEAVATDASMTISYTRLDVPIDENGSIEETQANAAALIEELGDCNLVESRP